MHASDTFVIASAVESFYFSHWNGNLCQWILLTVENRSEQSVLGKAEITVGTMQAITPLDVQPGTAEYRCYAPYVFSERPTVGEARLALTVGETTFKSSFPAGNYRPWKIYLLSDVCTDIAWVYGDWDVMSRDDAFLTETELSFAEKTRDEAMPNQNHYNLVQSHEISYFLKHFSAQEVRLADAVRRGEITLNPFYTMVDTSTISLEEQLRQFYPARNWALKHGLEIAYANHQESPTISWSMATVLAGCGIRHLVKAILPYECPWAKRLEEPPVFIWEGPDGSQIVMRRRNINYVEGNFVLLGLEETNKALHEKIIPEYQALGARYPFDAIGVLGLYGDLTPENFKRKASSHVLINGFTPQCHTMVSRKVNTIKAYNSQGWEYPQLINAAHKQFWDDVDCQVSERKLTLEVYRGDYGTSWDAWPACLAVYVAAWRRAQERVAVADKLAALAYAYDAAPEGVQEALTEAWKNLVYLSDHAWNGADDDNRRLNKALRRTWQASANQLVDKAVAGGLAWLGHTIQCRNRSAIAVFNSLGWARSGLVRLEGLGDKALLSLPSGSAAPIQHIREDDSDVLYFEATDIPAVGYRVYGVSDGESARADPICIANGYRLEGPFYSLELSPVTGGITSLYDKTRNVELVKADQPYQLNQCLYFSESVEYTPQKTELLTATSNGSLFGQLVVHSSFNQISLKTTYRLYANIDRLDIINVLEKEPTSEQQELDFVFPFGVAHPQVRYETPGAIIEPGKDHLPGAGLAVTAVRHFVDVFNSQHGVTLSQADSFLLEFGRRTTLEDPQLLDTDSGTILAVAFGNLLDWKENFHDQGGETHFTFRFSLQGHTGGFEPERAVRFSWDDNNELLALALSPINTAMLPTDAHSFVSPTPANVILACMKTAEEEGLILRLWECSGMDTLARVDVSGLANVKEAWLTDLLERDLEQLPLRAGVVEVPIKGRGLAAVRLLR